MKQMIINLTAIAAITFTLSFVTGMSVSMAYQEHQSLKPIIAAQEAAAEEAMMLSANASDVSVGF